MPVDDRWVDRFARALAERRTRRGGIARLAAGVLAVSGAGTVEAERASKADVRRRRRGRCRPACKNGHECVDGKCACPSGVACGEACCGAGQSCVEGACQAAPPPPACIGFGQPCKGVGRPCCEGLACGSGPGGMTDVGCYRPAGAGCQTTDDCVFGSVCTDGVCVAIPVPPPCTVCPNGCTYDSVARAVAEAAPGATVTVAEGVYDALVTIDRDLTLEACDGGRPVIRNGPYNPDLGSPEPSIVVTAGRVTLRGMAISCSTCDLEDGAGGGLVVASVSVLGAASRAMRRIGSPHDLAADPRRAMRLGRAAIASARAASRDAAPAPVVDVVDCEITGITFPQDTVAAVSVLGASVTLTDTVVRDNLGILGGGVLVVAGEVALDGDTVVSDNTGLIGGGVFAIGDCIVDPLFRDATVTIRDRARVVRNRFLPQSLDLPYSFLGGGGITLWGSSLTMTGDSAVEENQSLYIGGGIAALSGSVTLGCDDCPGTVSVARNVALGYVAQGFGGGVALVGFDVGPIETSDVSMTVRRSARIVDNVAYGPIDDLSVPGAGGGIVGIESTGRVTIDMTTASTGADPAVTRNHAVPFGATIGARDVVTGVGAPS